MFAALSLLPVLLAGCMSIAQQPTAPVGDLPSDIEPIEAPQPAPPMCSSLIGGVWQIVSINGEPVAEGAEPTMQFSDDGRLSGRAPCNSYFGEAAISTNEIVFANSGATQMACDPARMEQEGAFFQIISGVVQWRLDDGDRLSLIGRNGTLKARRGT